MIQRKRLDFLIVWQRLFQDTRLFPLGVSRRQLLWDGSPWVHENPFPLSVTLAKEATAGEHDSAEMVSRTSCEGAEW